MGYNSGIENPTKSEVIGRCGGDKKNEWPHRTDKSRTLKKKEDHIYRIGMNCCLRYNRAKCSNLSK